MGRETERKRETEEGGVALSFPPLRESEGGGVKATVCVCLFVYERERLCVCLRACVRASVCENETRESVSVSECVCVCVFVFVRERAPYRTSYLSLSGRMQNRFKIPPRPLLSLQLWIFAFRRKWV